MELLEEERDIVDREGAVELPITDEGGAGVSFRDVTFSYDGKVDVLKGISFEVPRGSTVALVGPSGGGKSTASTFFLPLFRPLHDANQALTYAHRLCASSTASTTSNPVRSRSTASICETPSRRVSGRRSGWSRRNRCCLTRRFGTISRAFLVLAVFLPSCFPLSLPCPLFRFLPPLPTPLQYLY